MFDLLSLLISFITSSIFKETKKKNNSAKHVHFVTRNSDKDVKKFLKAYLKKLKYPYWDALEAKKDNMFEASKKRNWRRNLFIRHQKAVNNVREFWKLYKNLFNCSFWRADIKNWKDWKDWFR